MRIAPIVLSLVIVAVSGCRPREKRAEPSLEQPDFEAHDWPDALRLSNGSIQLAIVPSVGRIMRFGFTDTPNVLWINPQLRPPRLGEERRGDAPTTLPARKNYGGDHAWPWPQDQWPMLLGRSWPPPLEVDQEPMTARLSGPLAATMESSPLRGYGVRLVRHIALDPREPRVTIVSRFERASADLPPTELAAWQITQLPFGGTIYAKLALGGRVVGLPPAPWTAHHEVAPGVVILDPPETAAGKTGLDADALAWAAGEVLFVARSLTAATESSRYRAGERAQVWVQSAPDPKAPSLNTPTRYVELEFTSPRKDLARDQVPELKVTWELHRIEGGQWTDANVVAVLQR